VEYAGNTLLNRFLENRGKFVLLIIHNFSTSYCTHLTLALISPFYESETWSFIFGKKKDFRSLRAVCRGKYLDLSERKGQCDAEMHNEEFHNW